MTDAMTRRSLGRATLARQFLLERAPVRAIDAIGRLAGMQAQAPLAPYIGLWTRLSDFDAGELAGLTRRREVVRLHVMRNTVHLLGAGDALGWRALFHPLHVADFEAHFGRGVAGVDRAALVSRARLLLAERPRTRRELGALLAEDWPGARPDALAYAATHHVAVCQVPPRGVWGSTGPAAWAPLDGFLGAPLSPVPVADLVLRYLGAFGPATVADVQLWSGLTRLGEVVARLPLRVFHGPAGQTLYDLPDAPRPAEDTPAPPRFLPAYDNLLLSHKDRGRVIVDDRRVPLPAGNGDGEGTFLVDGQWRGTWLVREGVLRIRPFTALGPGDRDALLAEAAGLAGFLGPRVRDVTLDRATGG